MKSYPETYKAFMKERKQVGYKTPKTLLRVKMMEKLYVNEIGPDGAVSTVGLFYSHPEAQKIVDTLRADPDRAAYRYEIVEAVRHTLSDKQASRSTPARGVAMPYIKTVPPSEAAGKLKQVYEIGGGPSAARGKVAMVRQVQSLHPDALAAWSDLGAAIMHGPSRLTRRQREMIATVVSATNHCSY